MWIKDIFFFHEHPRKINIWASLIILSPYFGPMFTAFIISTQKWQWAFGLYTIMTGVCLIAIVFLVDETYYDRRIPPSQQPVRKSHFARLIGTEQWKSRSQRSSFSEAVLRPFVILIKAPVLLALTYYILSFAWVVGINSTLSIFLTPLYEFGPKQIGKKPSLNALLPSSTADFCAFHRVLLLHPRCCRYSGRSNGPLRP